MPTSSDNTPQKSVDAALDFLLAPTVPDTTFYRNFRQRKGRFARIVFFFGLTGLALLLGVYVWLWRPPAAFPEEMLFTVKGGMTLAETGRHLSGAHLVRSEFWFKAWSVVLGGERGIKAGEYYFGEPLSVWQIAKRLSLGDTERAPIRVTIPEGTSVNQVSAILKRHLSGWSEKQFLEAARGREGYLFPDTYVFPPGISAAEIVAIMSETYDRKILPLAAALEKFGRPVGEVVIMASLLEEEARTTETRQKIAGILWKRLLLGMPLQVDAVFPYIIGKNTFEVTAEDLQFDSPYNTYKYAGLPPGPITNPGLDSIRAAVTPIETPYLYYLSDRAGEMHYATSHMQHLVNKEKYLRR